MEDIEQAHFDAIYLASKGFCGGDHRAVMAMDDAEREMLMQVMRLVAETERAEMVAAIVKALGG